MERLAHYHLPGLFEFHELYRLFIDLYENHREYFYDWCDIGSIYGAPGDTLWAGGRISLSNKDPLEIASFMKEKKIPARLTFSNSLLRKEHLKDEKGNRLLEIFLNEPGMHNGIIVHSDLLLNYIREKYPDCRMISSTTKVLTEFSDFKKELERKEFNCVVPDFRLNKAFAGLEELSDEEKNKVEFLVNECCDIACRQRKECYEYVSHLCLKDDVKEHICLAPHGNEGYVFSYAKKNPSFISIEDIQNIYLPMGFTNFKIEGRSLGSALVLEILLYYMIKSEYELNVREAIYLDNMLDLF